MVPEAIPPERLDPYGAHGKLARYAGSRRSTTWPTSSPTRPCWTSSALDRERPLAVVRTPPEVSLYHRFENPLFARVLERLARAGRADGRAAAHAGAARARSPALGPFTVPERAVDAQSLVAFADLVISAGGTMNREAVALGTPVYTTFEGKLGAVDEGLLREGRLRKLDDPDAVRLERRDHAGRLADPPGSA